MKNIVGMEKQDTAFLLSAFSFLLSALLHYLVILLGIGTGGVVEMPPFCS